MPVIINGSTGISGTDGSAGTPAVQGTDTNTGMFFPAADQIAFAEGGVEAMRLDASGNVGIGTSSPATRLDVSGGITTLRGAALFNTSSTSGTNSSAYIRSANSFSAATAPDYTWWFDDGTGIFHPAGSTLAFSTGAVERARITSGGELLVGTTNALVGIGDLTTTTGSGLSPAGRLGACQNNEASLYLTRNNSDGRIAHFYRNSTNVGGVSVTTTGTSFNTSSDYRLKENVRPMTNGLATVLALKPVTYAWKANGSYGEGFIAHELQQAIPLAVEGEKDAVDIDGKVVPQAVDYSKIVVHLVAAIQELKAENDALKARVAALEATP